MRRTFLSVFFLVAGLAAAAPAHAAADPAQGAFAESPTTNPVIAAEPAVTTSNAVIAADAGSGPPHTEVAFWTPNKTIYDHDMPHAAGVVSVGSPAAVWGKDTVSSKPVYVADIENPAGVASPVCDPNAGVYVGTLETFNQPGSFSWGTTRAVGGALGSATTSVDQPALTFDRSSSRLVAVYHTTTWSGPCGTTAAGQTLSVATSTNGGSWLNASIVASDPSNAIDDPAATVTGDGTLVVVYWLHGAFVSAIESVTCTLLSGPSSASCSTPVPVAQDVVDPVSAFGMTAHPKPTVVWVPPDLSGNGARIVVGWAGDITNLGPDVDTSTSWDKGATYTAPTRAVDDPGGAAQVAPQLSTTLYETDPTPDAISRADLSFMDARAGAGLAATTTSSLPTPGGAETWSQNAAVQSPGEPASLPIGARIAAGSIEAGPSRQPEVLIAYPDDTTGSPNVMWQLFHHTVNPPTAPNQTYQLGKNAPATTFTLPVTDGDADPLRFTVSGSLRPGATATIPNPLVGRLIYRPPGGHSGSDTMTVGVNWGGASPLKETVTVNAIDAPPVVICSSGFKAVLDMPMSTQLSACATDADGDPLTITAVAPTNGTLSADGSTFTPTSAVGTTGYTLVADDHDAAPVQAFIPVTVLTPAGTGKLVISGSNGPAAIGQTLEFRANTNIPGTVTWKFGDNTLGKGLDVRHKYTKAGTYTVSASAANGTADRVTVQVTPGPFDLLSMRWKHRTLVVKTRMHATGTMRAALQGLRTAVSKHVKAGKTASLTLRPRHLPAHGTVTVLLTYLNPQGKPGRSQQRVLLVPLASRR